MTSIPVILTCVLTGWFMFLVYRQFRRNRKQNLGFWTLSLLLSAIASLCYALALWQTAGSSFWFLAYYICGAMWMPSIMGLGSLALLFSQRTVWILSAAAALLGLIGTVELALAPIEQTVLRHLDGGAGTGVIVSRAGWLVPLVILNICGAAAVIVVALMSGYRAARKRVSGRFLHGNLWLAVGVLVISMAGTAARLGNPRLFWITMLIGWIVTFGGYHLLSPKVKRQESTNPMGEKSSGLSL